MWWRVRNRPSRRGMRAVPVATARAVVDVAVEMVGWSSVEKK